MTSTKEHVKLVLFVVCWFTILLPITGPLMYFNWKLRRSDSQRRGEREP